MPDSSPTDLVVELRSDSHRGDAELRDLLCHRAADEIESLRKALRHISDLNAAGVMRDIARTALRAYKRNPLPGERAYRKGESDE